MKKLFGLVGVVLALGILGCGEGGVKPDESMESTMKKAQKDNPEAMKKAMESGAKHSGKMSADTSQPVGNVPDANNK